MMAMIKDVTTRSTARCGAGLRPWTRGANFDPKIRVTAAFARRVRARRRSDAAAARQLSTSFVDAHRAPSSEPIAPRVQAEC